MQNLSPTSQTGSRTLALIAPEPSRRATYGHIQAYCRREHGFTPQTCWIADVLADHGLTRRQAPNRKDPARPAKPCPSGYRGQILQAMQSLGLISDCA